jgi:hypothetical protein
MDSQSAHSSRAPTDRRAASETYRHHLAISWTFHNTRQPVQAHPLARGRIGDVRINGRTAQRRNGSDSLYCPASCVVVAKPIVVQPRLTSSYCPGQRNGHALRSPRSSRQARHRYRSPPPSNLAAAASSMTHRRAQMVADESNSDAAHQLRQGVKLSGSNNQVNGGALGTLLGVAALLVEPARAARSAAASRCAVRLHWRPSSVAGPVRLPPLRR